MYSFARKSRFALLLPALCVLLMLAAIQPADTARGNYSEDAAAGGSRHPETDGIEAAKPRLRAKNLSSVASPPASAVVKLTPSDPAVEDFFGWSVSISGDRAIAGAPYKWAGHDNDGVAYVFYRDRGGKGNWGQAAKLTAIDSFSFDDQMGRAVSIHGDWALVGAPSDNEGGGNSNGSAYLFHRNQGGADNWGQVKEFTALSPAAYDFFGRAVSIHGDYAIVGMPKGFTNVLPGAAYIYKRNLGGENNWGRLTVLTPSDSQNSNTFGCSVFISGDYAIVGASGYDPGAAYVFYRNQGGADNWGQQVKLTASDGVSQDFFGCSVSLSGDWVIVGAEGGSINGGNIASAYALSRQNGDGVIDGAAVSGTSLGKTGSAYVFFRHHGGANNWGQAAKLIASDAAMGDWFGRSVSISGDYAIVGAAGSDDAAGDAGSVYAFYRNKGGVNKWGAISELTAPDAAMGDYMGFSVSISGDSFLAGAYLDDDAGNASGSAYIFSGYLCHSIWASAGVGGSISPSGRVEVAHGCDKKFTITPDAGCEIADVIVDKRSVGAISSYTFHNVGRNHVIKAEFAVLPGSVAVTLKGLRVNIPGLLWQVGGSGPWHSLGDTVWLMPGRYTITFLPVPGWLFPDMVIVVPGPGFSASADVNVVPQPIPFLVADCSDYDGDGASDFALFRTTKGRWLVRGILKKKFGREGDWPAPGDYDGDGTADLAYWRPGKGLWRVRKQFRIKGFGEEGDVPVPADYDGDGLTDAALFRRSTCEWIVRRSATGKTKTTVFAGAGFCVPLPGDYDGDGAANLAVYSLANNTWTIHDFGEKGVDRVVKFGREGEAPVPADYNCDGLTDIAMLDREGGLWRVYGLFKTKVKSKKGDMPVIGDFDCDGAPEFGLFRCKNGVWYLGSRIKFGGEEDIPLARGR